MPCPNGSSKGAAVAVMRRHALSEYGKYRWIGEPYELWRTMYSSR